LYKSQNTVDRFVDDIAFTCGVTRKDLKVVSGSGTSTRQSWRYQSNTTLHI